MKSMLYTLPVFGTMTFPEQMNRLNSFRKWFIVEAGESNVTLSLQETPTMLLILLRLNFAHFGM